MSSESVATNKLRNVAIIAHIDHGKTTLVDALLKSTDSIVRSDEGRERLLDSDTQEQERGITIFAKPTSVNYKDYKINFIDTPGHGDFSGEVQRMLGLVQSVLLIVDAREGPMPQTRYVLREALRRGLRPIVIINKVDRPHSRPWEVVDEVFDLMSQLGGSDEQLDFKYCFTSALKGESGNSPDEIKPGMDALLDLIVQVCPHPTGDVSEPFCLQVATTGYNPFCGQTLYGRVLNGELCPGMRLAWKTAEGKRIKGSVVHVRTPQGTQRVEVARAVAGDIVEMDGLEGVEVGDTLYEDRPDSSLERLDFIGVDAPTLYVQVKANFSPLAGKEGDKVTFSAVKERLQKEARNNISLQVRSPSGGQELLEVAGRGELHLAVVFEAMRREGYELCVGQPTVTKRIEHGVTLEPWESVEIIANEEMAGWVIEKMTQRGGALKNMSCDHEGRQHMLWEIALERLIGLRSQLQQASRGEAQLFSRHLEYRPQGVSKEVSDCGMLISMMAGRATAYALMQVQKRGKLWIDVGDEVYKGMVVGRHQRTGDLEVNPVRAKQLTNFRTQSKDEAYKIEPPTPLTLEVAIETLRAGQWIELTPQSIRMLCL